VANQTKRDPNLFEETIQWLGELDEQPLHEWLGELDEQPLHETLGRGDYEIARGLGFVARAVIELTRAVEELKPPEMRISQPFGQPDGGT